MLVRELLALRGGDPELRPTGTRVLWLEELELDDEAWAAFGIPIGLAFFFRSSAGGRTVALYPSPAGATECELDLEPWERLRAANPVLTGLEPDAEALIVNRLADPPQHAIAPIDECYRLVGLIRASGRNLGRGRAGGRDRGVLRRAAGAGRVTEVAGNGAPPPPPPSRRRSGADPTPGSRSSEPSRSSARRRRPCGSACGRPTSPGGACSPSRSRC